MRKAGLGATARALRGGRWRRVLEARLPVRSLGGGGTSLGALGSRF